MSNPSSDIDLASNTLSARRAAEAASDCADGANRDGILADLALAKRCVSGEVAAWEQLYAQCHDALLATIRKMLGPQGADLNLTDEISARVWYALVANDGELLERYSPKHGARLFTFMRAIAKDEIARHFRSEARRRKRERRAAARESSREHSVAAEMDASLSEFLATLTPTERSFTDSYLLAPANPPPLRAEPRPSATSFWRLTGRIRKKLIDFFGL